MLTQLRFFSYIQLQRVTVLYNRPAVNYLKVMFGFCFHFIIVLEEAVCAAELNYCIFYRVMI